MAVSVREMIFYVRAQNQASTILNRIARDFAVMGTASDKAAEALSRQQTLQAKMALTGTRINAAQSELATLKANVPAQAALAAAQARRLKLTDNQYSAGTKALQQERALYDMGTRRIQLEGRLNNLVTRAGGIPTPGTRGGLQYEVLTRQLKSLSMAEIVAKRDATALAESTGRLKIAIAEETTVMRRMQAAVNFGQVDKQAIIAQQAKLTLLEEEYAQKVLQSEALANAARQDSIDKLNRQATALHAVGRAAQLAGTVLLAGAGGAAMAAARFSSEATLAATQARPIGAGVGTTARISTQIQGQVLQQMQQFPSTAKDMNDAFYQVFSGTNIQNVGKAAAMIRVFNQAAVAGSASLHDMTEAGITIKNNFGIGGLGSEFANTTQAMNVFFAAVRYGRMNVTQFANALPYISPIAKDVGSTFRNIAEDMAFFTRQTGGRLTRNDAQGYARLIQLFSRTDVTAGLAQKGIPVFDQLTGKMRPVVTILGEIHDKLKLTPQETINFFKTISAAGGTGAGNQGTIQALRIFAQGIQHIKDYRSVVHDVASDNNEMTRSFQAMQKSPQVKWGEFINQLRVLVYTIGVQAIPAFAKLAGPILNAIRWFNSLSSTTKKVIADFAVFGGAFLLLGGTALSLIGSVVRLRAALITIRGAQGLAGAATEAGMFGAAMGPLGVAGAIIAASAALAILINQIPGFTKAMEKGGAAAYDFFHKSHGSRGGAAKPTDKGGMFAGHSIVTETDYARRMLLKNYGNEDLVGRMLEKKYKLDKEGALAIAHHAGSLNRMYQAAAAGGNDHAEQTARRQQELADRQVAIAKAHRRHIAAQHNATWQDQFNAYKKLAALQNDVQQHPRKFSEAQRIKIYKDFLDAQDKLQKLSVGNQYQAAVSAVQDELQAEDRAGKKKISNATKVANKKKEIAKQAIAAEATYQSQALQTLQTKYDQFFQSNQQAFGTLGQGPFIQGARFQNMVSWGLVDKQGRPAPRPQDLTRDLHAQIRQFSQFRSGLASLRRRGLAKGAVEELQQQGTAALPDIQALQKMTAGQLRTYSRLWRQGQAQIRSATNADFSVELKKWRKHGRDIAKAIAQGVADENFTLFNNLKRTILADLRGTPLPSSGKHGTTNNDFSVTVHGPTEQARMTELRHAQFNHRAKMFGRPD